MPKADADPTTSPELTGDPGRTPDQSPSPTRRGLLRDVAVGGGAIAATATLAVIPARIIERGYFRRNSALDPTDGTDAELIRVCTRFGYLNAVIDEHYAERHRVYEAHDGRYTVEFEKARIAEIDPVEDELFDLADEIHELTARTPAGCRAKANVVKHMLQRLVGDPTNAFEALACSLADDVLAQVA